MKILYAAWKYYDYELGTKNPSFSFEHYTFYDSLVRMDNGKHEIIYFPYDEIMHARGRDAMNEELEQAVQKHKPDILFCVLQTEELKKDVVKRISESGMTQTIAWMSDDHWRFEGYSRHWAPCFNWVVTTDSQAVAKYRAMGYAHVIKSQWACNHFLYKPQAVEVGGRKAEYKHEVSFIGRPHGGRDKLMKKLKAAGIGVYCRGHEWPEGKIGQEEMIKVFGTSKINLNPTNASVSWTWAGLGHIFMKKKGNRSVENGRKTPWNYFKLFLQGEIVPQPVADIIANVKLFLFGRREQIKGRTFEVPGCGGFLMTGDADNLRDYYIDGREIVVFRNVGDLVKKIRYYLTHDREREAIAKAGYERTLRDHTYEKRFRDIFEAMGLKNT